MTIGANVLVCTTHTTRWGWLFVLALVCALPGCLTANRNQELLESELRAKDRQIEELRGEVAMKDADVRALEVDLTRLERERCAKAAGGSSQGSYAIKEVTLGRLTGGTRKEPTATADDVLQVLVEPRDFDNQAVKAAGSIHVAVFEVQDNGLKTPLSTWDLTPREVRKLWDTPVFGGPAYRLELPWKSQPTTEKLRVVVRFTSVDGQMFEADKDIMIRLPEGRRRPSMPWPGPDGAGISADCPSPTVETLPHPPKPIRPNEAPAVRPPAPQGPTNKPPPSPPSVGSETPPVAKTPWYKRPFAWLFPKRDTGPVKPRWGTPVEPAESVPVEVIPEASMGTLPPFVPPSGSITMPPLPPAPELAPEKPSPKRLPASTVPPPEAAPPSILQAPPGMFLPLSEPGSPPPPKGSGPTSRVQPNRGDGEVLQASFISEVRDEPHLTWRPSKDAGPAVSLEPPRKLKDTHPRKP